MTSADAPRPPTVEDPAPLTERVRSAPGVLCGLDFDGTLAPIVTDPDAARVDPAVVEPLGRLADAAPVEVAVVSGRALSDLADRIPVDGIGLAGNHGLERRRNGERQVPPAAADTRETIRRLRNRMADAVGTVPGCRVEDKGLTLSVHVRETPTDRVPTVRAAVTAAVEEEPAVRLNEGKAVFEIRPATDHDKGTAMADLRAEVPDDWLALYVGDDTTDEDAFRAIQPDGVGIHVGDEKREAAVDATGDENSDVTGDEDGDGAATGADGPPAPAGGREPGHETAAAYSLPDQSAVAPFLRWLTETVATA